MGIWIISITCLVLIHDQLQPTSSLCSSSHLNLNSSHQLEFEIKIPTKNCPYNINEHLSQFTIIYILYVDSRLEYMKNITKFYKFDQCFQIKYIRTIHIDNNLTNNINNFKKIKLIDNDFKLENGKLAHQLGYIKTLSNFISDASNLNNINDTINSKAIIFEDDIAYPDDNNLNLFIIKFNYYLKILYNENFYWEFINIGRCFSSCMNDKYVTDNIATFVSGGGSCTHSIAFSYYGAIKLLQASYPVNRKQYDLYILHTMVDKKMNNIKSYSLSPRLFYQNKTLGSQILERIDEPAINKPECVPGQGKPAIINITNIRDNDHDIYMNQIQTFEYHDHDD